MNNEERNKLLVVESVMRLKNLKNNQMILKEAENLYSHTNTRGRKRFILLCRNQEHATEKSKELNGQFFKSWGTWVCLYEIN